MTVVPANWEHGNIASTKSDRATNIDQIGCKHIDSSTRISVMEFGSVQLQRNALH